MTSKPSTPARPRKAPARPQTSATATSTPRLSEYARKFTYPPGISKTVWPRVEAKGKELGLGFDWWQSQAGTVILGYDENGKYVATVGGVGMSIPRQVGKTYFVLALIVILCILFPGLQVVWTAHHLRTSTKTFKALQGIVKRKTIWPHIKSIRTTNGEQEVEFANKSKIMFGARSQGFGRGFDEIDVEVFDEAQILDTKALEDMIAATNQARHEHGALVFFMGTPPRPDDPSESFEERRAEAWAGEDDQAIWLEIGADPDSDPNDPKQFPLMNPSFPLRTPLESLQRLRKMLKNDESWNREGRGIWDQDANDLTIFGPFEVWRSSRTEQVPDGVGALGVALMADRSQWALCGASAIEWTPEDDPEAEPIDKILVAPILQTSNLEDVIEEAKRIQEQYPDCVLLLDEKGPASTELEEFENAGLNVEEMSLTDMASACAAFEDGLKTQTLTHLRNVELDRAVRAASWRWVGDFRIVARRNAKTPVDIAMLEAAIAATHGAEASSAFNIY